MGETMNDDRPTSSLPRTPLRALALLLSSAVFVSLSCSDDGGKDKAKEVGSKAAQKQLLSVQSAESWTLPGLHKEVQVVRTEGNTPHIYAHDRHDLAMVQGFVIARDRFFFLDLGRRLGLGKVAELLGDAGLDSDYESRHIGMTSAADNFLAVMTAEQLEICDAFAAGINAYIEEAKKGTVPLPSEVELAAPLLGYGTDAVKMMAPFGRRDVAGFAAVLLYNLGYETGDIGRGLTARTLDKLFEGKAFAELRRKGAIADIWNNIRPVRPASSASGFGLETATNAPPPPPPPVAGPTPRSTRVARGPHVPKGMLQGLVERFERLERALGHDHENGWGSNAWAVAGTSTTDGASLLAGDGHMPLTIPSYFYQIGLDTSVYGGGKTHQAGLVIPGMPLLAVGTNGHVAWSQTQLMGDITDWYVEELTLDDKGAPKSTLFQGAQKPVEVLEEAFSSVAIKSFLSELNSVGGDEVWQRFKTFDGRWLMQVEGKKVVHALIYRVDHPEPDDPEKETSSLFVARLSGPKPCIVGKTRSNKKARKIADDPTRPCIQ